MNFISRLAGVLGAVAASVTLVMAQTPAPAAPAAGAPATAAATDVYSVMFVKAAPGQAAALAKQLQQQPNPKDPMGSHYLLLRHQEGADWDFCVIQHTGTKATVEITPLPPAGGGATMAWHEDTYVSGPSWPEFQRAMGMTGTPAGSPVYLLGVHRAVPGHRTELEQALRQRDPNAKPSTADLLMTHLDGGNWQFLTLSRYASWQELATERAAAAGGSDGWNQLRQHSAAHSDTIADRVR